MKAYKFKTRKLFMAPYVFDELKANLKVKYWGN